LRTEVDLVVLGAPNSALAIDDDLALEDAFDPKVDGFSCG
jgi:hypothetical protein